MIRMNLSVVLMMFVWKLSVSRGDTEVSCVVMETCILPCSFQVGPRVVILWIHLATGRRLHSYYDNQDQLLDQDQSFINRTSLFKDQISRGNFSLQLTGVKVQDEGTYMCFTNGIHGDKTSIINLQINAPVCKVDVQQEGNNITCSSEGIYPEPELTWSTTPPSNINLHNTTTVQQNEQQLYSISSSLILSHSHTDLLYSCTVTTHRQKTRAAWRKVDTEVSCVVMETCILPCSFQDDRDVIIHWLHLTPGGFCIHSYYSNQDQLLDQDQNFINRTSLFKDQISRGNASLQLTGVKVQDEGRYECLINTMKGKENSFINLKVNAPVHEVNIQQVENRITCSSEGIYPEPELTWSTTPPSNINLHNTTIVQQNEQQLYSISSSLILSHSHTDLLYSCTVTTPTNRRRAAWRKLTPISGSTSQTIITCAASNFSFSHLLWRFKHSQMILNQSRTDGSSTVSEEWRQQVKDVSESGDITLQDLSSEQEGIYTCQLSNAEETLISDTSVKISGGKSTIGGLIVAGILPVLITTGAVSLLLYYKKEKGQRGNNTTRLNNHEFALEDRNEGTSSAAATCLKTSTPPLNLSQNSEV